MDKNCKIILYVPLFCKNYFIHPTVLQTVKSNNFYNKLYLINTDPEELEDIIT